MSEKAATPDAIYFDTNVLVRARWPTPSARLLDVITQAERLGIPLCLPELVQRELIERRLRELDERRQSIYDKVGEFNRLATEVFALQAPAPLPDREVLRRDIGVCVAEFTARFRAVPITQRPLDEFLTLALTRGATFKEHGHGFQDAVILWSILDDMTAEGYTSAVVVSEDNAFRNAGVAQLARGAAKILHVLATLEELEARLTENSDVRVQEFLAEEKRQLIAAIEARRADLKAFLTTNLSLQSTDLQVWVTVRKILSLEVDLIDDAHRSWSWFETKPHTADENKVSVDVVVRLRLEVEHFASPKIPILKVGETVEPKELPIEHWLQPSGISEQDHKLTVTVEANVERTKEGYAAVHFTSVYVKRDFSAGLLGLMRGGA